MLPRLQQILLEALLADNPPQRLQELLASDTTLDAASREMLQRIAPDGLTMSGLIIKKLRFERLTHGEPSMEELFKTDPAAFMRLYENYTGAVPPTAYFPSVEAELFQHWQKNKLPH